MGKKISPEMLTDAVGNIDDRYIVEAHADEVKAGRVRAGRSGGETGVKRVKTFPWKPLTAAAAVVVVVLTGAFIAVRFGGLKSALRSNDSHGNNSALYDSESGPVLNGKNGLSVNPVENYSGENDSVNFTYAPGNLPEPAADAPATYIPHEEDVPLAVYYWDSGDGYKYVFVPAGDNAPDDAPDTAIAGDFARQNAVTAEELETLMSDPVYAEFIRRNTVGLYPLKDFGKIKNEEKEPAQQTDRIDPPENTNDSANELSAVRSLLGITA
ncbi:MAG: hypothetical protein J5950_08360 [Clostridia bacterium]|nr:hypothetical protein [Clostridia bacterium]